MDKAAISKHLAELKNAFSSTTQVLKLVSPDETLKELRKLAILHSTHTISGVIANLIPVIEANFQRLDQIDERLNKLHKLITEDKNKVGFT